MDRETTIEELQQKIKQFCDERDWDQFHNAKDLVIGLVTESSELLQHFRFKSAKEVDALFLDSVRREQLSEEMADAFYFLLRLAQRYDVDLATAVGCKLAKNAEKYPVEKSRGSNKKYTEY